MNDLAIIIVSWNVKDRLRECLSSIFASTHAPLFSVIVVDNASRDGSADMVATEFPNVLLIRNNENVGCSRALNQGLRVSESRYVLWLNPDMRLFPDTLRNLVLYADTHPRAAGVWA